MIPSRLFLHAVLALAMLALLAVFVPSLTSVWQVLAGLVAAMALIDALRVHALEPIEAERQCKNVWPVGQMGDVIITLRNPMNAAIAIQCMDHYPVGWQMEGLPFTSKIESGHFVQFSYALTPDKRGNAEFKTVELRVASPWNLWWKTQRIGDAQSVKVFPDFSRLLGHSLLATDRRAPTEGIIRKRRRGEGTDFRQLREYREGDSPRTIDWKATAREQKLISREYQEERDQQVVFLLDTGRRMRAKDAGGCHFDHALDAVLTLGFIAQKQGDSVGLMSFGEASRWLTPQKGRVGLDRVLAGVYDLQPSETVPDFTQAAAMLMRKLQKRAFVVVITNLSDEDDEAIKKACAMLSIKHLVLIASLRETILDDTLDTEVLQFKDALKYAGTMHFMHERQQAVKRFGINATQWLDVLPSQLSMKLVNRYLDIKESGQL